MVLAIFSKNGKNSCKKGVKKFPYQAPKIGLFWHFLEKSSIFPLQLRTLTPGRAVTGKTHTKPPYFLLAKFPARFFDWFGEIVKGKWYKNEL